MRRFPFVLWQQPQEAVASARFSIEPCEETWEIPTKNKGNSLESLRSDVIVELSNRFTQASIDHPRLAPILMDALDNALELILLVEHQSELRPIQQWLCLETQKSATKREFGKKRE